MAFTVRIIKVRVYDSHAMCAKNIKYMVYACIKS